jgi:hypothetical protein
MVAFFMLNPTRGIILMKKSELHALIKKRAMMRAEVEGGHFEQLLYISQWKLYINISLIFSRWW